MATGTWIQPYSRTSPRELKAMRHEMFHYIPGVEATGGNVIRRLDWASELHEAMGVHIAEYLTAQAALDRQLQLHQRSEVGRGSRSQVKQS